MKIRAANKTRLPHKEMADTDVNKPESSGAKEVISFKVPKRKNLRKKQDSSDEEDASTQQNEDEVS